MRTIPKLTIDAPLESGVFDDLTVSVEQSEKALSLFDRLINNDETAIEEALKLQPVTASLESWTDRKEVADKFNALVQAVKKWIQELIARIREILKRVVSWSKMRLEIIGNQLARLKAALEEPGMAAVPVFKIGKEDARTPHHAMLMFDYSKLSYLANSTSGLKAMFDFTKLLAQTSQRQGQYRFTTFPEFTRGAALWMTLDPENTQFEYYLDQMAPHSDEEGPLLAMQHYPAPFTLGETFRSNARSMVTKPVLLLSYDELMQCNNQIRAYHGKMKFDTAYIERQLRDLESVLNRFKITNKEDPYPKHDVLRLTMKILNYTLVSSGFGSRERINMFGTAITMISNATSEALKPLISQESAVAEPVQSTDPTDLVCQDLNQLVSSAYTLHVKYKNFHWHLRGSMFYSYHELLETHALQLYAMIDAAAERVRMMDQETVKSISDIQALSQVTDSNENRLTSEQMLTQLLEDNTQLQTQLNALKEKTGQANDHATSALVDQWLDETQKRAWFIRSTLES